MVLNDAGHSLTLTEITDRLSPVHFSGSRLYFYVFSDVVH